MKTNNNNRESKNQSAYKEQQRTFGQAFDQEYYKQILETVKGRKVFHFGTPADTVRVEVKRECEGYFRISMKRGESSDVEYFREYIDWETILSTDRAARLLADYRADHHRAHQFKLGALVRVNDEKWGQVNGHVGRIVRVVLQNRLVGSYYEVEFVGDLPKFDNGNPMKANNFEPLDIEPVEEVTINEPTLEEPQEIKAEGIDPCFTLNRENISPVSEYINDLGTMYANIRPEDDPEAAALGYCRYMTKKPGGEWTENRCMSWHSLEYALYVFNARPMTFAESVEDRDEMEKPTDMYALAANIDRLLKRIASRGTAFAEVLSYIECYPDMGREFLDAMQCRDSVEHFRRWCAARQKHLRRKAA